MNVQNMLDAAAAANATTMASGEVSKIFRESFNNSIKCRIQLKADDRSYLARTTTFPLVFTAEKCVTSDHALLASMREIARDAYAQMFAIPKLTQRTLVVGAAAREIRLYNANPAIHYYVYGKENKDYDRIILPALGDIANELKKKAKKNDTTVFLPPKDSVDTTSMRPVVKRYLSMRAVLDDYVNEHKLPANIHLEPVESSVLLFEDSIYNFGAAELCDIFSKTKANIAYGYCLLPFELLFQDIPKNRIYWFNTYYDSPAVKHTLQDVFGVKMASLTFRQGCSNGYVHEYEKWKTLLASPAIKHAGVSLAIEICARVGCMAIFKVYRCAYPEKMVRTLELPPHEAYVNMLDLYASIDHGNCKLRRPLKYFQVREAEFFSVFNFLVSIDVKSLTLQNCILYTRRLMGGMSLSSKELVAPWDLPQTDAYRFAISTYLQAYIMQQKIAEGLEKSNPTSVWEKFKRLFVSGVRMVFYPITWFIDLILAENLTDKIVVYPDHHNSITQRATLYPNLKEMHVTNCPLYTDFPNEDRITGCPFCDFMAEDVEMYDPKDGIRTRGARKGKQEFKCSYKQESDHEFALTTEQCSTIINKLMDDDNDAPGLAKVKELAKKHFPKNGFTHKCRVSYLRGGPGTGKSYTIRSIATITDLILAPFTKLKSDYMNVPSLDGKIDLCFKTPQKCCRDWSPHYYGG